MITLHMNGEMTADRKLVLTLPAEAPPGKVEVQIRLRTVAEAAPYSQPGLLEWAEQNAEARGPETTSEDVEGFTGRRF